MEEARDVFVRDVADELLAELLKPVAYDGVDLLEFGALLDALVDAVLDEDALQRLGLQLLQFRRQAQFQLPRQIALQLLRIAP